MNSEYFWWLAALALVAGGGLVAVISWRPSADDGVDDGFDDGWADEPDGMARWPDEPADARPA
jgi:hypothetical protein